MFKKVVFLRSCKEVATEDLILEKLFVSLYFEFGRKESQQVFKVNYPSMFCSSFISNFWL